MGDYYHIENYRRGQQLVQKQKTDGRQLKRNYGETGIITSDNDNLSKKAHSCSKDHRVTDFVTLSDSDTETTEKEENGLTQNEVINFMSQPILNKSEVKALFLPTLKIADGKIEVLERLGSGAYGNVFKVREVVSGKIRALKIIRSDKMKMTNSEERESMNREITSLTTIANQSPPKPVINAIVKLFNSFTLNDNICILYELLGPTLHYVMRSDHFKGFAWKEIRSISYQICVAVNFMHSLKLVHHDIKPENILFAHPSFESGSGMEPIVKLIDFGSTISVLHRDCRTATTIRYRSPEVGLKGTNNFAADIWSLGCTMFEIYSGHPLFNVHQDEVEKYYMIEAIFCDVIPPKLAASSGLPCFDKTGKLKYDDKDKIKQIHEKIRPFQEYNNSPQCRTSITFFGLLTQMLAIKTTSRVDSHELLHHSFFKSYLLKEYEPRILIRKIAQ